MSFVLAQVCFTQESACLHQLLTIPFTVPMTNHPSVALNFCIQMFIRTSSKPVYFVLTKMRQVRL